MAANKQMAKPMSIACQDLSYSINGKMLLHQVNFLAEPGSLVVIVGPSGAGKSTLLNNLALRSRGGVRTGSLLLNGYPVNAASELLHVCSYVMTDDPMLRYLTVYETLMTAAELKLPDLSSAVRALRVERVIEELGLTKCRNTYIGGDWKKGISTGERKRVCIAVQLLNEPSILILDEPTSGLDSTLACEILSVLQRLASHGHTVICSVHQPTSQMWLLFDHLVLLSRGAVLYNGKTVEAKRYFALLGYECPKNYNPADYFSGLISNAEYDCARHSASGLEKEDKTSLSNSTIECGNSSSDNSNGSDEIGTQATAKAAPCLNDNLNMMEGGCFIRPVADIRKLANAFRSSIEADVLRKRIEQLQSDAWKRDIPKGTKMKGLPNRPTSCYKEIRPLLLRSLKNSIRNPVVCCVLLLVHALQGIILGGIFWQLQSDIKYQTHSWNTTALLKNPWTQLFIHGIDGRQPLLEALENGVDGQGSQPLVELLSDKESMSWLRRTLTCAIGKMRLTSHGYPTFHVRPDVPPEELKEEMIAEETVGNIIGLLQQLDYQYMKRDYKQFKEDLKHSPGSANYWLLLTSTFGADLLNPFMSCSGYPSYPAVTPSVGYSDIQQQSSYKNSHRRQLISIGETGIENAIFDLGGMGSRDFVAATRQILDRLRTCDNRACRWIGRKYNEIVRLQEDAFLAVMAIVNILGALFFMVANLGFASYDALLTFPQERALFNRESANGFYRASSYFIGKNIADLGYQILPSFLLVTIYYFCIGTGTTVSQYSIYAVIMAGTTFAAYGFGYFISAVSPRMEIAVLVAPAILVIWLTIAGFFLRDAQIPKWIRWLSYLSFYKWGFFSVVLNQFPLGGSFGVLPNRVPLTMAGITETRLWVNLLMLFALGFAYRVAACVALKFANRKVGLES